MPALSRISHVLNHQAMVLEYLICHISDGNRTARCTFALTRIFRLKGTLQCTGLVNKQNNLKKQKTGSLFFLSFSFAKTSCFMTTELTGMRPPELSGFPTCNTWPFEFLQAIFLMVVKQVT